MPPFPDTPRVRYTPNPLHAVVCQIRFPEVLRIAAAPPADFQERIRQTYPQYEEKRASPIPDDVPERIRTLLAAQLGAAPPRVVHEFSSADGAVKISLDRGWIALTDTKYERWETFRERLLEGVAALTDVYKPAPFQRVGLRYQNAIRRSKLGLKGVGWHELLMPHIAGELGDAAVAPAIDESLNILAVRLPHGRVQIRHGIGEFDDQGVKEDIYVIDSDFHSDGGERPELGTLLDEFNRESGRLFRWCLAPRLHQAMDPRPVQ